MDRNPCLPSYADIAQALYVALAKHAHRNLRDTFIDALCVEERPGGPDGGWDISFVILPEDLAKPWEAACAEVQETYPYACAA